MEGGFESWILQYPMYVNKVGQNAGEHCVDSLESIVAGYKRGIPAVYIMRYCSYSTI